MNGRMKRRCLCAGVPPNKALHLTVIAPLVFTCAIAFSQNFTGNDYKSDYLEGCELISKKYIYFERKCTLSRSDFLKQKEQYADSIIWNQNSFIKEIRDLRTLFPDGHFGWKIPRNISPLDGFYTLGFVPTFTSDSVLVVKKVFPYYTKQLRVNDTIVEINSIPAKEFIKAFGIKAPQSTINATHEIAARNLSLIKYNAPIIDSLEDIEFTILRNHQQRTFNVGYYY